MARQFRKKDPAPSRGGPGLRVVGDEQAPLRECSDETLMAQYCGGRDDAFAELLKRHHKKVLNYLYRMVHNRHIAEELTQEVFAALVRNAERYQPTAKFTTYLYTIASNKAMKEWTRGKRRPQLLSLSLPRGPRRPDADALGSIEEQVSDDDADVVASFKRGEISEAVNEALRQIPAHQREAFVLRRFQDVPYEEIAKIANAPVGTVKSRVARAEHALRPLLEQFREYM